MDPGGLQEMREFADGDMGLDTAAAEVHEDGAVGEIIKLTADGALTKQILIAGKGNERPGSGDEVFVHYVGTLLDGTPFDSSRDRDEPFTFTLGEGRVIKGWDQGVATMRKGEKSILTCGPDYAYGASGSPPKIPGGATLQFEVELLNWKSIKDIAGDGGVIKTVTVEGDGFNKPQDRDEVTVVYSIKVQGSEQPVIVSEPQGEEFTVSAGLRGLLCFPTAVKTMKKGEKATLLVDTSYGFGAAGAEGVPPNSSLEVELQLVSFKKIENVTEDGKVTKKTIVDTEEWKRPNEGSQVTVRLTGTLADGTLFESHPQGEELVFTTDSEMVCDGLDLCVMKMKKGERCLVTVPPEYAYGAAGHTGKLATIPPEATLTFDVELVEVENAKETWDMSDTEKVEAAVAQKEKGNAAFKTGKLQRAVHLWDKAVLLVAYDKTFPDDVKAQVKEVKRSLWLNLSAAHLKLCHWKEAVENATKVLEHEPFHVKALYRSAQGLMGTQDFVEAEEAIKKGLTGEPANADLLALQRKLKVACKHVEAQEKALFSKMFASKPRSAAAAAAPIPVEAVVPPADA